MLEERSAAHLKEKGHRFWDELIEREEAAGERFVARTGGIVWLCPFAPQGQKEVWAVFEERSDFRELSRRGAIHACRGDSLGPALLARYRQQRL